MLGFWRCLVHLNRPVLAWLLLLAVVNGIAPLAFLGTVEGRMVLAAYAAGVFLQLAIYDVCGFVRLLGLGHVFWLPMVVWLGLRLPETGIATPFGLWLAAAVAADSLSLALDAAGVARYLRGDRKPLVSAPG